MVPHFLESQEGVDHSTLARRSIPGTVPPVEFINMSVFTTVSKNDITGQKL